MNKKVTFIGHSECWNINKEKLESCIIDLITKGATTFLSGGMGNFDWLCARTVNNLRKNFPQIKNILVIPYLTFNIQNKEIFDEIIYPEGLEKYHFKEAIIKRNKYMIDRSDYAVCFIEHEWGGAAKTYKYAQKQGLKIMDLGNYKLRDN